MAFTVQEYQQPERWTHFSFFTKQKAGSNVESLNPDGQFFKLEEVRLHFSSAFASSRDFTIRLSSIKGSEYNLTLLSQALSGIQDLLWQPDRPLVMLSDDQVVFSWTQVSDVNTLGLNVLGWGVLG